MARKEIQKARISLMERMQGYEDRLAENKKEIAELRYLNLGLTKAIDNLDLRDRHSIHESRFRDVRSRNERVIESLQIENQEFAKIIELKAAIKQSWR